MKKRTYFTNKVIDVREPINLSYVWNLGSLMGILLVFQIISGVGISISCCPHEKLAFLSVAGFSWVGPDSHLLRHFHATGHLCFYDRLKFGYEVSGERHIRLFCLVII